MTFTELEMIDWREIQGWENHALDRVGQNQRCGKVLTHKWSLEQRVANALKLGPIMCSVVPMTNCWCDSAFGINGLFQSVPKCRGCL